MDEATLRAGRIAGIYAVVAAAWIGLSDSALGLLVADHEALVRLSVAKGLFYVVATTALLLVLMRRSFVALDRSYDALVATTAELRTSERQLSAVVRSARDGIVTVDDEGRIVTINPAARAMLGCGDGDVMGARLSRFVETSLPATDESTLRLTLRAGARRQDGSLEASTSHLETAEGGLRTVVLRDVSERRAYEVEIERLNRLYAALSAINQTIARASSREDLFRRACAALVEHGGFALAWICWREEGDALELVASAGEQADVLDERRAWTEEQRRASPSWAALRDDRAFISNDMVGDPSAASWSAAAKRLGWKACGSFPMRMDGEVVGLLNVVAETKGVFKDREVELLQAAAIDLSFALDRLVAEDRRRLAEAAATNERRFSDAMIESMPGVVYFYDEAGRFLRWNRDLEVVSGYSAEEIEGMSPLDFVPAPARSLVAERIEEALEQGSSSVEAPFATKGGTRTPYLFTGRRVYQDGKRCLVGVGIDISERVRAERELRRLASTLEQRIAERTEELRVALERAEEADRLKSAFLATMSHELRTPLNSIIGFTGILLQKLAGPLNDEQRKQLGMVQNSARHLLALINDVLDLSKIEAGQLDVEAEPFDLRGAIEEAVATVEPMAAAKGLRLEARVEPEVARMVGDRRRVAQVLLNLLNNAVKFTERGGVRLEACPRQDDGRPSVAVSVADTGIGIAEPELGTLFEPFRQVDTGLTRQHDGTGLGLTICRRLVDLMGGRIDVSSTSGEGSVFTVVLPLDRARGA